MRYSVFWGLIGAFVFGLLSITNANATLIERTANLRIRSYFDDNGNQCAHNCGSAFLQLSYDPADLLNTFQYELDFEGFISFQWLGGTGSVASLGCEAPDCRLFDNFPDAFAWFKSDEEAGGAYVGQYDVSEKPFKLSALTAGLIGPGFGDVWFREGLFLDRFGQGEWGAEEEGQDIGAIFGVPEPPSVSIFLLGLFVLIGHGFTSRLLRHRKV